MNYRVPPIKVFNTTYAGINSLLVSSGFEKLDFRLELTELAFVKLPKEIQNLGITIMDGQFFSSIYYPSLNCHSLTHVRYTPHIQWHEKDYCINPYKVSDVKYKSKYIHMLNDAKRYLPILNKAKYLKSMYWSDEGFLLSKYNFNENSIIVETFTLNHGKCSGIVYGGSSRKQKKNFQIGNKILLNWKSKNENKMGYFNTELIKPVSPLFFDDKKKTICLLAASSILKILLPERQINKQELILRVVNDINQLLHKKPRIYRVANTANSRYRVIDFEMPRIIPSNSAYPVSRASPKLTQCIGKPLYSFIKIRIRNAMNTTIDGSGYNLTLPMVFS